MSFIPVEQASKESKQEEQASKKKKKRGEGLSPPLLRDKKRCTGHPVALWHKLPTFHAQSKASSKAEKEKEGEKEGEKRRRERRRERRRGRQTDRQAGKWGQTCALSLIHQTTSSGSFGFGGCLGRGTAMAGFCFFKFVLTFVLVFPL